MKKLALLLTALGVVSVVSYGAEPVLKVTSVGQEIEIENVSGGSDIGEDSLFGTTVGLSYGDWTFAVTGGKFWDIDTDNTDSKDGRLQMDAWKKFDNYKLGFRYRGQKDFDRYYLRGTWDYDVLWGAADIWYQANNKANDAWRGEIFPIGVKFGSVKIGWFIDWTQVMGRTGSGELENNFEHQIRAYATFYKGKKITLSTEGRFTLTVDDKFKDGDKRAKDTVGRYEDFGRNRIYLGADYQVNTNLNVYLKYGYEVRNMEKVNDGKSFDSNNYYGDFIVGWNYKF